MADDITLNSGSGGATLATDDLSGIHYQRVKVTWGGDGTANDTTASNPLPVAEQNTVNVQEASALDVSAAVVSVDDNAGSLTVDGTVTADAGTGTFTVQEASAMDVSAATVTVDQTDDEARLNGVSRKDVDPSDGATALTTKFAVVDVASSGDNTIVSAVAGSKIRVLSVALVASAATTVQWQDGGGANLSGGMQLAANGGYTLSSDYGLFETGSGNALVLNLGSANSIDGHISYVEV